MANRLYNKQISPKGYKAGGQVSSTRQAKPKAVRGVSPSKQQRKMGQDSKPKKTGTVGGYTIEIERVKKKMGGSLKPVNPQTQKGLSKLSTEVRNKMGYMKKGGKVHGK